MSSLHLAASIPQHLSHCSPRPRVPSLDFRWEEPNLRPILMAILVGVDRDPSTQILTASLHLHLPFPEGPRMYLILTASLHLHLPFQEGPRMYLTLTASLGRELLDSEVSSPCQIPTVVGASLGRELLDSEVSSLHQIPTVVGASLDQEFPSPAVPNLRRILTASLDLIPAVAGAIPDLHLPCPEVPSLQPILAPGHRTGAYQSHYFRKAGC
ncbi:uncharacterized protein IUM83_15518 [Phytophthora cinnamomi]|uniref:uncharacterized protein n=1 Tax=Phytophthora cinnamomi TaxID=4785 RepID=UPI003559A57C|nr:hypothetical protein IUM83_15518 [Phytophthora cinnamomi]